MQIPDCLWCCTDICARMTLRVQFVLGAILYSYFHVKFWKTSSKVAGAIFYVLMLTSMFHDFAQDDKTLIHVAVILLVFLFFAVWGSLELGRLNWQGTWTRLALVVSFHSCFCEYSSLGRFIVLPTSTIILFSLISRLSKSIVLKRLSKSKENKSE